MRSLSKLVQHTSCGALLMAMSCKSPPEQTSVPEHEQQASELEESAIDHEASYDPDASVRQEECEHVDLHEVCWTAVVNPTDAHRQEARRARKLAAQHRQTAQDLRDAEGKACLGVSARNRDLSPFARAEDIANIERIPKGARVQFSSRPGLTRDRIEQMVGCHLARNRVLGTSGADMPYCPLTVPGVRAEVTEEADGVVVTLDAGDGDPAALGQRLDGLEQRVSEVPR